MMLEMCLSNKVFASGQAIREASLTVLRPTEHGAETSRTQKQSLCGFAASGKGLNRQEKRLPSLEKTILFHGARSKEAKTTIWMRDGRCAEKA